MTKYCLYFPVLLACVLPAGCALTSKATPLQLRFFTPTTVAHDLQSALTPTPGLALRLGRIEAGAHVEQRIAFRTSETELGYYESLRWTESPAFYLRNQLATALYDERGVARIIAGIGPTLDLELNEFEELQFGERRARVGLRFVLRDERRALLDQLVVVDRPVQSVSGKTPEESFAHAMAMALAEATSTVANRVVEKLQATEGAAPADIEKCQ
jgi:ABC-type uncharacterized transport system auxiliary subunit